MATTTQILFNSPALHSLKREQLVKLCKIHSIKANGKNAELIARLQEVAAQMPQDTHGAEEPGADGDDEDHQEPMITRPSEQWEVVMDDIEEVEEDTYGTASSKRTLRDGPSGEFGTSSSKTSVSSSIMALATSLGIKRAFSANSIASSQEIRPFDSLSSTTSPRPAGKDALTRHAVPYSAIPPSSSFPRSDYFKFSTPDDSVLDGDGDISMSAPVPGNPARPGMPAPQNARLSTGTGLTTTVRLIATSTNYAMPSPPRIAPVQPAFELDMGTPGGTGEGISKWPATPSKTVEGERLYPALPLDDFPSPSPRKPKAPAPIQSERGAVEDEGDVDMPGGLPAAPVFSVPLRTPAKTPGKTPAKTPSKTPAKYVITQATPKPTSTPVIVQDIFSPAVAPRTPTPASAARLGIPRSTPFVFGSPLPQNNLSNKEFGRAAESVLEEMNRRLAESGQQGVSVKVDGAAGLFGSAASATGAGHQCTGSGDRFAKVHEDVFSKMDSIANHYAARRPAAGAKKRKSDVLGVGPAPNAKRASGAAGTRVISTGVRKKMGVPGAFGDDDGDDDVEEAGDRRSSKRMRVEGGEDVHKGKRVSIAPSQDPIEEKRKQKEREAIRKKVDARRRSSRGGVSVGGKAAPPEKSKASRFGFLASAKSIVRNVWNMGAGSSTTKAAPKPSSHVSVSKAPQSVKLDAQAKTTSAPVDRKPSTISVNASIKTTASRVSSTNAASNKLLKPPRANETGSTTASTKSSSLRFPIPSFAPPSHLSSINSTAHSRTGSLTGTANSKAGSSIGTSTTGSRLSTRSSSMVGSSSIGMRNSQVSGPGAQMSSLGTRCNITATSSMNSKRDMNTNSAEVAADGRTQPVLRTRTSSLLAPTASSLAKMHSRVQPSNGAKSSGLLTVTEQRSAGLRSKATSPVVASTVRTMFSMTSPRSPKPTHIFSQPLTAMSSPSSNSSGVQSASLASAGTALLGGTSIIQQRAVPPKPSTLIARKPRISRSRVVAKLGAQRAVGNSQLSAIAPSGIAPIARKRPSMGARKSFGGVKSGRQSAGAEILQSAKKRARQTEYARRKSRVTGDVNSGVGERDKDICRMDVDE